MVDFHQTVDVDGIRVTAYRAGHVLGAAMFQVGRLGGWVLLCAFTSLPSLLLLNKSSETTCPLIIAPFASFAAVSC